MKRRLFLILLVLALTGCGNNTVEQQEPSGEIYIDRAELTEAEPERQELPPPEPVKEEKQTEPAQKPEQETVQEPAVVPPQEKTEEPEPPVEPTPERTEEPAPERTEEPAPPPQQTEDVAETPPAPVEEPKVETEPVQPEPLAQVVEKETAVIVSSAAAVPEILTAEASGALEKRTDRAVIDYSNTGDGYVMVQFFGQTDKRLKAQVKGPNTTYTYNLTAGQWEVFPLSDGNGAYQTAVFENVTGSKYATVTSVSFDVALEDEFAPYLLPNQYVNYSPNDSVVQKAAQLAGGESDTLKKVELVYDFVVTTLTYDRERAATVKSGYLPHLDSVLKEKKGICFDYAALMTAMLRSQGVPCKLVVGYAGTTYHAWISVWTAETGWVDGAIFFDGAVWHRMDPTFASSANRSDSIMQYIGDGSNYSEKYLY